MYYFKKEDYSNAKDGKGDYKTYLLKNEIESKATRIKNRIRNKVQAETGVSGEIYQRWVSKSDFGFIFSDYEIPKKIQWNSVIGSGHKKLFELIKDQYHCIFLSKYLSHNTKELSYDDNEKFLIININYFKEFSKVITKKNAVSLFLYKFDSPEVENVIRTWLIERPKKFQLILDTYQVSLPDVATVLEHYKPETLESLNNYFRKSSQILKSKIAENYQLYIDRLRSFELLINEEKTIFLEDQKKYWDLENRIRDFIRVNPWIIDFTYDENDVRTEIYPLVDVLLVGSYLEYKKGLLIELKRPDVETIKKYRDKDAIRAGISDAISQLIHYTSEVYRKTLHEAKDSEPNFFIEGMIIIGKYMHEFLPTINQYLHNVTIKTYEEIYEDAKRRLDNFKEGPKLSKIEEKLLDDGVIEEHIGIKDSTIRQVKEISTFDLPSLYAKLGETEGSKFIIPYEEEKKSEERGNQVVEYYTDKIFQKICVELDICNKLKTLNDYDIVTTGSFLATILGSTYNAVIPVWIPVSLLSVIIAKIGLKKFCKCD